MGIKEIYEYRRCVVMWRRIKNIFKKRRNVASHDTSFANAIKNHKKEKVSMDDVVDDIFFSKELYDKLKVRYHPDRYVDPDLNKIATEIYQEITKNKTNYKKLKEIQEEAKSKLENNVKS